MEEKIKELIKELEIGIKENNYCLLMHKNTKYHLNNGNYIEQTGKMREIYGVIWCQTKIVNKLKSILESEE